MMRTNGTKSMVPALSWFACPETARLSMKFQRIEKPGSMPQSPHQFSLLAHWEPCTCLFFCWAVLGSRLKKSIGFRTFPTP